MLIKPKNTDEKLSDFICVYLLMNTINSTLPDVLGISSTAIRMVIIVIMMILFIRCLHRMNIHTFMFFGVGYALCIAAFLYSFLVGSSIASIGYWANNLLIVCLPLGISAYAVRDKQILYNKMLRFSYAILVINTLNMFSVVEDAYDMHFSYCMLFVLILHLNEFISHRKIIHLILSIAELLMIVIHGSRGALVCVIVFIVICILRKQMEIKKKVVYLISLGIIAAVIFKFIDRICTFLVQKLSLRGISSRTLNLFLSGGFWNHDTSRDKIWEKAEELIAKKPWFGWGIGGYTDSFRTYSATYPHNLFFDLFLAFGIILGSFLVIILIVFVVKAFLTKNVSESQLALIFISIAIVSLMFSGTIFNNYYFFIMLGIVASINKYKTSDVENYKVLVK